MIEAFVLAVICTLGVSALCSVLEAMLLSSRSLDVKQLKQRAPRAGQLLEILRGDMEGAIASILTVNTVANTLGSVMVGALAAQLFGNMWLGVVSGGMTLAILFFSEILPKNVGVIYRPALLPVMVFPLFWIYRLAGPVSRMASWLIRKILKSRPQAVPEGELEMVAERETREGRLSPWQARIIQSSLELAEITVEDLMTPRNVVVTCGAQETMEQLLRRLGKMSFARMPVVGENPDDIVGVLRRKDALHALATGRGNAVARDLMQAPVIVPEIGRLMSALETLLAGHQQLAIVVDEFGGFAGVLTLEDVLEFLIGREFYEADDVAVDMQELARRRSRQARRRIQRG